MIASSVKTTQQQNGNGRRRLSLRDFVDPTKPWDLTSELDDLPTKGFFSFVPRKFKEGPWSPAATLSLVVIVAGLLWAVADANAREHPPPRASGDDSGGGGELRYAAYTVDWWYNAAGFAWMSYVSYSVYAAYRSFGAWVSFTMWSWTVLTVRHGLSVLAPFAPSVRPIVEIARFPALLSASVTFVVWNFVLFPVVSLVFFRDDPARRKTFVGFMLSFRLIQIHVFNIAFAALNAAWAEPRRPLEMRDVNAGTAYILAYMSFYYLVLDRVGVHLYPIFSPRTPWAIASWLMTVAVCVGCYVFWRDVLLWATTTTTMESST